jgi:chromosome partitioning protein
MTINCLIASDSVIVPLEAEFFAFKGIDTIISVIDQVNKAFGKNIKIDGVILNEYNPRKKLTQSIEAELRTHLKETLLDSRLRTNIAISESQINGKTVYDYDPNSNGAKDFEAIVTELIKKEKI